jgi:uncharacterized membrane protein
MPNRGAFGVVLTLHIITAVFVIGPLAVATMTAPRLVRGGQETLAALRGTLRATRSYSVASIVVAGLGFSIVTKGPFGVGRSVTDFWIIASVVLWAVAVLLSFFVVAGSIKRAIGEIEQGRDARRLIGPIAGAGGIASLCWIAIVVLMVVKPGA